MGEGGGSRCVTFLSPQAMLMGVIGMSSSPLPPPAPNPRGLFASVLCPFIGPLTHLQVRPAATQAAIAALRRQRPLVAARGQNGDG
jgi:hypothetical protein